MESFMQNSTSGFSTHAEKQFFHAFSLPTVAQFPHFRKLLEGKKR